MPKFFVILWRINGRFAPIDETAGFRLWYL